MDDTRKFKAYSVQMIDGKAIYRFKK